MKWTSYHSPIHILFLLPRYPFLRDSSRKFVYTYAHTRTDTHTHLLISSISKIYFLSPSAYWVKATRKPHIVRGGRYSSVLPQIQTHNLSPWLRLLPVPIHPEFAARAIFPKYCFPRVSAQSLQCFLQPFSKCPCLLSEFSFVLLHSIYSSALLLWLNVFKFFE